MKDMKVGSETIADAATIVATFYETTAPFLDLKPVRSAPL